MSFSERKPLALKLTLSFSVELQISRAPGLWRRTMRRVGLIVALCAAWSVSVLAHPVFDGHPSASEILDDLVTHAEKEIVPAAEAMPEEKYAFSPTNGEFGGVRTFAQQLKHLAAAN